MVERLPASALQRRGVTARGGNIDASSGALASAQQIGTLGTAFFQNAANNLLNEVSRQVVEKQTAKGRKIGLEATTTLSNGQEVPLAILSDETSIAARSRNAGVLESYTNRLNTTLLRNMEELARNNSADPVGYEEQARDLYGEIRKTLPNPEIQTLFDNKFEAILQPEITRQHVGAVKQERADTRLTALESVQEISLSAEREAQDAMSFNADLAAQSVTNIAQRRGELLAALNQTDANGDFIFSPDQQQAELRAFDFTVQKSAVLGGFRRATDKESFIDRWATAERENRSSDALTATQDKTQAGRRIYKTSDGQSVSELSITVTHPEINAGKPTNIPTVYDGKIVTEQQAVAIVANAGGVDPDTGRELDGFDTIDEAEEAARARSQSLRPVGDDGDAPNADFKSGVAPMLALQDVDRIEATMRSELRLIRAENAEVRAQLRTEASDAATILSRGEQPAGLAGLRSNMEAAGMFKELARLDLSERLSEEVVEFSRLPLSDQQGSIATLDQLDIVGIFESEKKAQFRKVHAAQVAAVRQGQGLGVAVEAGVIAPLESIDYSDPETLKGRAVKAGLASAHVGIRLSPLTPQEAGGLRQALDEATPGEVAGILDSLHRGLGEEQAGYLAGQIAPNNPELSAAITLAPDSPLVARDIVLGGRLLAENPDVKPGQTDRINGVKEVFGNMFTPETAGALDGFVDAGMALYASRRVATGDLTFDSDTFEQALREAAGNPVKINKRMILPPRPGMTEDEVEDLVLSTTDEDLALYGNGLPIFSDGTPFSVALFDRFGKDAQLVTSGPGRYLIFFPGLGYIQSDRGGAYEIDLRAKVDE
ncbi:hypothetical protein HBA54_03155 [Pelagibius litoralis]|uniref:Uncharacterized protein n=1 Tax=Pelagibius litoralis TaxID=374515 RepID=A0A967EX41_9PROT|nr:hypothetical protein [Pelagibius litoralis]NIA67580.1 hypothetical protein [Pelagibius litoralis]